MRLTKKSISRAELTATEYGQGLRLDYEFECDTSSWDLMSFPFLKLSSLFIYVMYFTIFYVKSKRGPCKGDYYNDKHRKIGKVSDNDANDSRLSLGRGQAQVAYTLLSKIYIYSFLLHNIDLILFN